MNRYILFFFLILSTLTTLRAQQSRLVEVGNGYSQTSVNTTVFRNNSLVTQETNSISVTMTATAIWCSVNGSWTLTNGH